MAEQNYHDRDKAYRAAAGLNQSSLKPLRISPAHAKAALEAERKTSAAMAIGILTERMVACPDDLRAEVKADGRTAAGKAQAAAAAESGLLLVGEDDWTKCERMAANVKASVDAQALLAGAAFCQPCYWTHEGQQRKALFDAVSIADGVVRIVDLKTTSADLTPDDLAKQCATYGYHLQAAWYLQGARAMWPDLQVEFWFVFVESSAPHCVVAVQLDDDWLESGAAEVEALAEVWQACSDAGVWPGPAEMAVNGEPTFPRKLSRPKWSRAYSLEV
jgi:hypothetical protein